MKQEPMLTRDLLDTWALHAQAPVALHMEQRLVPVEGADAVFFPPTYADIGYNIDTLADGRRVATVDSVGSQANRMEPIFKASEVHDAENPRAKLVPQINIETGETSISLLDVGHRIGDALIRASSLQEEAKAAIELYHKDGDANAIAQLAPTSLTFGFWDSRGTMAKMPRLVQSVIRAWDVEEMRRSAVYTPPTDYAQLGVFSQEDKEKEEGNNKSPLAQRGYVHVPSSGPGGVVARGPIVRHVTVNLVALRRLRRNDTQGKLRKYLLGLSLVAATDPGDGFLRQGCMLVPDVTFSATWQAVHRDGERVKISLTPDVSLQYAEAAALAYGVGPDRAEKFSKERARSDAAEKSKKSKAAAKK